MCSRKQAQYVDQTECLPKDNLLKTS